MCTYGLQNAKDKPVFVKKFVCQLQAADDLSKPTISMILDFIHQCLY
jgi:hypothetical protein